MSDMEIRDLFKTRDTLQKQLDAVSEKYYKTSSEIEQIGMDVLNTLCELQSKIKKPKIIKDPCAYFSYCGYDEKKDSFFIGYTHNIDFVEYNKIEIPIDIISTKESLTNWFNSKVKEYQEKNKDKIEACKQRNLEKRKALYEKLKLEFENQ